MNGPCDARWLLKQSEEDDEEENYFITVPKTA